MTATAPDRALTDRAPIGVVWDPVFLTHLTDEAHPEHPRRLTPLYRRLENPELRRAFVTLAPSAATDDEIRLVHSPAYLDRVKGTAALPATALSKDTLTCAQSFHGQGIL